MARLPAISGAKAVKAFEKAGWSVNRQRGSHIIMLKPGHLASLSIPQHKTLAPGHTPQPVTLSRYFSG